MANDPVSTPHEALRDALRRQERDLRMMALDIHDGLLQYVIGALYHLESGVEVEREAQEISADDDKPGGTANAASDSGPGSLDGQTTIQLRSLATTRDLLQRAIAEGRRLIRGMRPPILVSRGLIPALSDLIEQRRAQSDIKIEFEDRANLARYSSLIEGTFFRIAQEAISNACQHSQSPRVVMRLIERGDRLRLDVQDWGIGFDKGKIRQTTSGLSGIQERAQWMGGVCEISTAPGMGTLVSVELPVSSSSSEMISSH
jgi:signal transduction histidine kinase